jgi:hypothetical protein
MFFCPPWVRHHLGAERRKKKKRKRSWRWGCPPPTIRSQGGTLALARFAEALGRPPSPPPAPHPHALTHALALPCWPALHCTFAGLPGPVWVGGASKKQPPPPLLGRVCTERGRARRGERRCGCTGPHTHTHSSGIHTTPLPTHAESQQGRARCVCACAVCSSSTVPRKEGQGRGCTLYIPTPI